VLLVALQEGRLLQPTIATHHVCGQLTGIAMQGDDFKRRFTDDCCQVNRTYCALGTPATTIV